MACVFSIPASQCCVMRRVLSLTHLEPANSKAQTSSWGTTKLQHEPGETSHCCRCTYLVGTSRNQVSQHQHQHDTTITSSLLFGAKLLPLLKTRAEKWPKFKIRISPEGSRFQFSAFFYSSAHRQRFLCPTPRQRTPPVGNPRAPAAHAKHVHVQARGMTPKTCSPKKRRLISVPSKPTEPASCEGQARLAAFLPFQDN